MYIHFNTMQGLLNFILEMVVGTKKVLLVLISSFVTIGILIGVREKFCPGLIEV